MIGRNCSAEIAVFGHHRRAGVSILLQIGRHRQRCAAAIGAKESGKSLEAPRPERRGYEREPDGQRQYGLIAEEVAKVYPELVVRGPSGWVESIQDHELIPMLVNELQHQKKALDAQTEEIASLRAANAGLRTAFERAQARVEDQDARNAAVAARLAGLEAGAVRPASFASR